MAELQAYNNLITSLAEDITDTETDITVSDDMSDYSPPFRMTIGEPQTGEIVEVTSIDNDVLTVTRGMEDTSAQSWDDGAKIQNLGTAGMHEEIVSQLDTEEGLSDLLPRDGSREMTDNLDMQNNNIVNVDRIEHSNSGGFDFRNYGVGEDFNFRATPSSDEEIEEFLRISPDNAEVSILNANLSIEDGDVEITDGDLDMNGNEIKSINNLHTSTQYLTIFTEGEDGDAKIEFEDSYSGNKILELNEGGDVEIPNGRLGIGAPPDKNLQISDNLETNIQLRSEDEGVNADDILGALEFYTSDTSASGKAVTGRIRAVTENEYVRTKLTFGTTDSGGNTITDNMIIDGRGNVEIPNGDLDVDGDINGDNKNFVIDHPNPDKREDYELKHTSVESPDYKTMYEFEVTAEEDNDEVTIELPDYFQYLNKNPRTYVSGTNHFGNGYAEVNEDLTEVTVYCEKEGEYNIMVTATRKDDSVDEEYQAVIEKTA